MGTEIPLSLLNLLPEQKKKELLEVLRVMKECERVKNEGEL